MKKNKLIIFIITILCSVQVLAQVDSVRMKQVQEFREDYNRNAIWAKGLLSHLNRH